MTGESINLSHGWQPCGLLGIPRGRYTGDQSVSRALAESSSRRIFRGLRPRSHRLRKALQRAVKSSVAGDLSTANEQLEDLVNKPHELGAAAMNALASMLQLGAGRAWARLLLTTRFLRGAEMRETPQRCLRGTRYLGWDVIG